VPLLGGADADAALSVSLPAWACAHPDSIFASGFQAGQSAVPTNPSNGIGGAFPGSIARTLHVSGLGSGTQTYYLYVPDAYTPMHAWPLLLALHGTAPFGSADSYAQAVRSNWQFAAEAGGFIVAAPVADAVYYDTYGQPYAVSWQVPPQSPNDYDLFDALRSDVESAYNIERTRIYGWGFSSGGHVMHDLGVNAYSAAFNASTMAAYGVSAGDLHALACAGISDAQCALDLTGLSRRIPVDIHIGTSDPNYTYAQADHTRFVASGWADGQTIFYTTFSGGHSYSIPQLNQIWHNLCPNAVAP